MFTLVGKYVYVSGKKVFTVFPLVGRLIFNTGKPDSKY